MTKEEIRQEAKRSCVDKSHYCIGGIGGDAYCEGYIAAAAPREKQLREKDKRIIELEEKLDLDLQKENEELKEKLAQAKIIMDIGMEGIKHWGIVGGRERPFEKQAELEFNLFFEKADQFCEENK